MTAFAGWEMPVQYSGILEEHLAVRTRAGLFDVSHMGRILLKGKAALSLIQRLTTNDASKLLEGQAQYSALCHPRGTFVDDILVYKLAENEFMVSSNAINREKDYHWFRKHKEEGVGVEDASQDLTQLALQGPTAQKILATLTPLDLSQIKYYRFARGEVDGIPALISRTGYTGEDGFELYFSAREAERLWEKILRAGKPLGLLPAGLGSRDTLRLEAGMCLFGQDIDDQHTPIEADLGFIVKPGKGDYVGREVHLRQLQEGTAVKLGGLEMVGRGVPRPHHEIFRGGRVVGQVTSGNFAPSLKKYIGLAYIQTADSVPGTEIEVEIRGQRIPARIVATPFYQRRRP
jgi:aminomethyltransferase